MGNWLETKYINLLSSRLRNFKRKGNIFNMSCPICGDSETDSRRARAYIYEKQGKNIFYCHNCSITLTVSNFIKKIDQTLYSEFQLEKLQDNKSPQQIDLESFTSKMKKPVFMKGGVLSGLKKVSQLKHDNRVKTFVTDRKIPNPYHAKLFACPNFMHFVNNIIPNKFSEEALKNDETRLLIPFFDKNNNVHALQGRSLRNNSVKYITIVLDESVPKVYGLDTVNLNETTFVFEGPIDSMFIQNSLAVAGGDSVSALSGFNKKNKVIVYDNEPRSKETYKKLDKAIMNGYNICVWPDNLQHKDVNDMVLGGLSPEFIAHTIKTNTYRDLAAKMALNRWSKL